MLEARIAAPHGRRRLAHAASVPPRGWSPAPLRPRLRLRRGVCGARCVCVCVCACVCMLSVVVVRRRGGGGRLYLCAESRVLPAGGDAPPNQQNSIGRVEKAGGRSKTGAANTTIEQKPSSRNAPRASVAALLRATHARGRLTRTHGRCESASSSSPSRHAAPVTSRHDTCRRRSSTRWCTCATARKPCATPTARPALFPSPPAPAPAQAQATPPAAGSLEQPSGTGTSTSTCTSTSTSLPAPACQRPPSLHCPNCRPPSAPALRPALRFRWLALPRPSARGTILPRPRLPRKRHIYDCSASAPPTESTNARVLWFSVFSVAVLLSTAAWQARARPLPLPPPPRSPARLPARGEGPCA